MAEILTEELAFGPYKYGYGTEGTQVRKLIWYEEFSEAALEYFAAMSVEPDDARKSLINTLIVGLQNDGIWAKLDWFCLLAAHDAQAARLNAVNVAKSLTEAGTITFTTDRGYTGDGATGKLDAGEAFGAGGSPNFVLASATIGVWCNLGSGTARVTHLGHNGTARTIIQAAAAGINDTYQVNDGTLSALRASPSKVAHRTAVRDAGNKVGYIDGAQVVSLPFIAISLGTGNVQTHCLGAGSFSADRLAAVYWGAALSETEVADLHSHLSTYLTAIGAN